MKFIFFVVLCAIALSVVYSDCSDRAVTTKSPNDDNKFIIFDTYFEFRLYEQYEKTSALISEAWLKCNDTFPAPWDEAIEIFQNPPRGELRYVRKETKCLMDCTMRAAGVMTDEGFQYEPYMRHIKQLRFNYTSYDINTKSAETKRQMLDTIWRRGSGIGSYAVILNYSWAAQQCKDVKDPEGDNCETSWLLMRCTMDRRMVIFNSPFFPVLLKDLQ